MWTNLKQAIDSVIRTNDNQEITGAILNNTLKTIVNTVGANATYAGIATPSTNPGTPDGPVFYFATEAGTYVNFGGAVIAEGLTVLFWDGITWSATGVFNKENMREVYDISAAHSGTEYTDLATALGTNGANVPSDVRKGGMSVKFVQSNDHKYVQWRLMKNQWSTTVSDWQGVDDVPNVGSDNLVKSGGVDESIYCLSLPLPLYDLSSSTEITSSQTGLLTRSGTLDTSKDGYYFEIASSSASCIYIKFVPRTSFNNSFTNLCIYRNNELVSTKPILGHYDGQIMIAVAPGCSAKLVANTNKVYTSGTAIQAGTQIKLIEENLSILKNQVSTVLSSNNYSESFTHTPTSSGEQGTYRTLPAPIKNGTKIKVKATAISGSWTRLLLYYNGSTASRIQDNIISGQLYEITLTEDIFSLGYYITYTGNAPQFNIDIVVITDEQNEISIINNEISILKDNSVGKRIISDYISNSAVAPISNTWRDAGAIFNYDGAIRTDIIQVNPGDVILTNAIFESTFGADLYSDVGSTIETLPNYFVRGISSTPDTHSITVQEGEHFVIVSSRNTIGYDGNNIYVIIVENGKFYKDDFLPLENRVSVLENEVDAEAIIFQDKCNRNAVYEQDIKNKFLWKKFDKAYFSWTNDDARSDMYLYQDLCETYGFPYCPAIPFEYVISNPTINGIALRTRLATILNNGGEILEHSTLVLNTANPYISDAAREQWYKYFRDGKRSSEKILNTKINGLIKAGGTGGSNPEIIETQKWCLTYFNYADIFGNTPQFRLSRTRYEISNDRTEDQAYQLYVAAIDDAVLNHKWLRLYCHGVEEVPITLLTRVFDYIQTKITNGDAAFVTWNYMYEHFQGSTLDKVVNPSDYN